MRIAAECPVCLAYVEWRVVMDGEAKPQIVVLQAKRCSLGWMYTVRLGQGPTQTLLSWRTAYEDAIVGPEQNGPNTAYARELIKAIVQDF